MDEIEMGTEIYLEPEGEKIKNAKEIAQASKNAEKYIFCIKYEATEKSVVLSEIKRLECEILEQSDSKGYIMIEASMAQLAAIKTLNCIEKVEIADTNATQKNSLNKTEEYDIMSVKTVDDPEVVLAQTNEAVSANDEISLMCYDDCDNDCDNSNTMQTAISLPIGVWKNGCICCPGAEVWYKFTANISNASEYIIYSSGLTDVVAELYDSCGMYIARGDDEEGYPNFNITRELTYGCTYYVKVYAYGSNTGEYNVRINYNTVSSGGSDDCDSDCSNNQASAIQLNLNTWQNGCICCYGAEAWYKFTPATTAYYTIYTLGSLDTTGSIYDADCNWLNGSDDEGFGNNFKIVHRLLANHTYYIKVMAFGSDTGNYEIVVTNKVFVDSVTVNEEVVILDKGKTQTLSATILPEYATNKALYWESDNTDVVTVNSSTGKITAIDGGKACVCAYAQDGSGKSSCCEVFVTVPVESVIMDASTRVMRVGEESQFTATVCPENADLKALSWESTHPEYATVDYDGLVTAVGVGNTVIKAISKDNESKYGECAVEVKPPIRVQSITMCEEAYTMNVGETTSLSYTIYPDDATNQKVSWYSSNPEVAFVQYYTGEITALKAGTTTITATTDDGSFVASCEVWVHGKTPVFLIHGRTSNSFGVWGAGNKIFTDPLNPDTKDNDHYDFSLNALSQGNVRYLYTDKSVQDIFGYNTGLPMVVKEKEDSVGETQQNFFVPAVFNGQFKDGEYIQEHPEGGNLAYYLKLNGYKENINLFVFNYPNEDAVKYSAEKFEAYINNLISYVRTSGSNEMKACFYASRSDYDNKNHKINIVGHSMGGLVARYFIENMYYTNSCDEKIGYDKHVDKLITICTPHWGSGYADLSNLTGNLLGIKLHALCDHDLDFDSAMYGVSKITTVNCDKGSCPESNYIVTPALQYQRQRSTKYYAIAGIDFDATYVNLNDHPFEMPTNFVTCQEISDYLESKKVYKEFLGIKYVPNPKDIGDNMVGFLSQIGWIGDNNNVNTPEPKIQMEKIFVDVDTNGGNGGELFIWEVANGLGSEIFHNKAPHRIPVCDKVIEYLED